MSDPSVLQVFPKDDLVFLEAVKATIAAKGGTSDLPAIQSELRKEYPSATITVRLGHDRKEVIQVVRDAQT